MNIGDLVSLNEHYKHYKSVGVVTKVRDSFFGGIIDGLWLYMIYKTFDGTWHTKDMLKREFSIEKENLRII